MTMQMEMMTGTVYFLFEDLWCSVGCASNLDNVSANATSC